MRAKDKRQCGGEQEEWIQWQWFTTEKFASWLAFTAKSCHSKCSWLWLHPLIQRIRQQQGSWHHLCSHGDALCVFFFLLVITIEKAPRLDCILTPPQSNKGSTFRSIPPLHEGALLTSAQPSGYRGHPQTGGPHVWSPCARIVCQGSLSKIFDPYLLWRPHFCRLTQHPPARGQEEDFHQRLN